MKQTENQLILVLPLKAGDYIELFDHSGKLVHEGLLSTAPGSFDPFRDEGWGLWTYFFQNLPNGVSVCTPHQVEVRDGTGYCIKARPFLVLKTD